jgi:hypothetical protein
LSSSTGNSGKQITSGLIWSYMMISQTLPMLQQAIEIERILGWFEVWIMRIGCPVVAQFGNYNQRDNRDKSGHRLRPQ